MDLIEKSRNKKYLVNLEFNRNCLDANDRSYEIRRWSSSS